MGIIVGKTNPRVIGGVDTINSGKEEVVIDATEQSEGLVDIDEAVEQAKEAPGQAEIEFPEEQPAPKKKSRKGRK